MGAKATTTAEGQRAPAQESRVTELALGELRLSDIRVRKTVELGELAREELPASDGCTALTEGSDADLGESLLPCSTLRVRESREGIRAKDHCACETARRCVAGKRSACDRGE